MAQQTKKQNTIDVVISATDNFTKILSVADIKNQYRELYWGGNGVGDRWCNKYFNYSVIYRSGYMYCHLIIMAVRRIII